MKWKTKLIEKYLVLHLLINISLHCIKIKLLKFNPLIKPPIDCQNK